MHKHDSSAACRTLRSKVFVEISIAITIGFEGEPDRKAPYRLASQMCNRYFWGEANRITSRPNTKAQIYLLVMIEKSFVKAAKLLEKVAAKQDAGT
jgi:hypothetical protein